MSLINNYLQGTYAIPASAHGEISAPTASPMLTPSGIMGGGGGGSGTNCIKIGLPGKLILSRDGEDSFKKYLKIQIL